MPSAGTPEPAGRAAPDPSDAAAVDTSPPDDASTVTTPIDDGPPPRPPVPGLAPPPRPELGGAGFVATTAAPPMPSAVSTGLGLWVGSLAAGLLAAGSVIRSQAALRDRFTAAVLEADPTTTLGTAEDAANVLVWVVVGGLSLIWLLHLILVVRTAGGHGAARWALVLLGLLGGATVLLLQDVISDPAVSLVQDLNRVSLIAQAVLAVLGSVALALPRAGRWFKELRRRR